MLILVALLVGAAAPLAGRLVDRRGERLPAVLGLPAAGAGLVILAIPGVSLHGIGTAFALVPVGLGLGLLFVPTSRAALNATEAASHGRASAILSAARLVGAAVGAGLGGAAVGRGADRVDGPRGAGGGRGRLPAPGPAGVHAPGREGRVRRRRITPEPEPPTGGLPNCNNFPARGLKFLLWRPIYG